MNQFWSKAKTVKKGKMGYRQSEIGSNRSERRGKYEKDLAVKVGEIRVYCGETLTPRSGLAFASDSEHNASCFIV